MDKKSTDISYYLILRNVSRRMDELGIKKYGLSKVTGISEPTLGRYFSEKTEMSLNNYIKICNALGIDLNGDVVNQ